MKEILINNRDYEKEILLIDDGELTERYIENKDIQRIEGNIYIGKIENILQGMQSAFVDIGQGKNAFIHLKDILPKIDVVKEKYKDDIDIKEVVKIGMPILVQVKKDFTESKGAKVSTHISINSRFIVLMPNTTIITISQKIEDENEKERLTNMVKKYLPINCGAIIRTASQNKDEDILKKDIELSVKKWNNIKEIYNTCKENKSFPRLIYKSHNVVKKLILDLVDKDLEKITVNEKEDYEYLSKILNEICTNKIELIFDNKNSLLEDRIIIKEQIEKINKRKIWLKCGGFITIDKTEALTAIDVNSGKYIGRDNAEETIYNVNKEASVEIAKQLKLRNIGGIIIIDYINMELEEDHDKIIKILSKELKEDRAKTQIIGFSKLNLLELTRKHICRN